MDGTGGESAQVKNITDLMIEVIRSPSAALEVVELAGELIAENARFNQWAYERKSRSSASDLWNLTALARHCYANCSSAWQDFHGAAAKRAQSEAFLATLRASLERLRRAREGDSIEFDDPSMPQELREQL